MTEPAQIIRSYYGFRVRPIGMMILIGAALSLNGQGLTRSTGLGLQGGFWKINNQSMGIHVGTSGDNSSVNVEGAGGSLNFFSRLHQNWFIESSLGSVTKVQVVEQGLFDEDVNVSVMIPFLLGLRYDLLTSRVESKIQPFVCAGTGTYWLVDTSVQNEGFNDSEVSTESNFYFGGYAGAGTHLVLTSWFALNAITRYHFVDFSTSNPNSGFEFGLGFTLMWGHKRELFKVQSVKVIVQDIYPAYYRFYNTYPLAYATIQNTAGFGIEVNIRSWIDGYTDGVRQSGYIEIPKGEEKDIPVYLLFGPELMQTESREPAVIDLIVEARSGVTLTKNFSAQVTVHSRNAWNGDIDKLTVFVTPDEPTVHQLSRASIKQDTTLAADPEMMKFKQARCLFEALTQRGIAYQSDPNIPYDQDDRVQFAPRTLSLGTGDCDDLVVLYASLLESIGISAAFVDVRDPELTQGHVYLMFDTGLAPEQGGLISSNEKRYLIREKKDKPTIWIPVEVTLLQNGFEPAWRAGATQYLDEGILRQGLAEGWVRIVDIM